MAEREFRLPDLGEGLEDAEIVEWLVAAGDTVLVDQPLVEVETAKANVELPSPYAGTITTLHGDPGDRVLVGAPLVTFDVEGSDVQDSEVTEPAPAAVAPARGPDAAPTGPGAGTAPDRPLVGYGAGPTTEAVGTSAAVLTAPAPTSAPTVRVKAAPPVRKRARELGVDLGRIAGTGPQGSVTHADLDRVVAPPGESADGAPHDLDPATVIEVRGVRRAVAEKMVRSRREIPDASTWVECDATALMAARAAMNARDEGVKVTPLALVLRACVAGLHRFPRLNARYHAEREEIEELAAIHLGVAAQTDRGLIVPVIRDAHRLTTLDLVAELARLATGAREGTLAPNELVGSTFTISNFGVFGVDGGVAIINHPEVAILGVGRFVPKPWVVDDTLVVRTIVELSLSFDHRAMDGGDAGGFLRFVADCVEQPATLLAHS